MKKKIEVFSLFILGVIIFSISEVQASSVVKAYTYNQDSSADNYCVTGEEATCQKTTCYEQKTGGSCPAGTIIEYQVNNDTTKFFYVLYDDSNTITMQQRENVLNGIAWNSTNNNTQGPITALETLEEATKDWNNVREQTYTMGYSNFGGYGLYTGCSVYNSCSQNKYTLNTRTSRARLITVQEAVALGCTSVGSSCPKWVYNYLSNSITHGGTVNSSGEGIWTMNSYSGNEYQAWNIYYSGGLYYNNSVNRIDYNAIRPVILIDKPTVSNNNDGATIEGEKNTKNSVDQEVNVKDTFRTAYIGYCIGTIILILGIVVIFQTYKKQENKGF